MDSFTDAKVELMAKGFASCTGDYAFDVDSVKAILVKPVADQCGLTAPFSPLGLDSCLGALALFGSETACGSDEERTPDTCASAACATFFDSFTDANVELMVAGLASCTGDRAAYRTLAAGGSGFLKLGLKSLFASCGRTTPFPQEPLDTCFGAIEEISKF